MLLRVGGNVVKSGWCCREWARVVSLMLQVGGQGSAYGEMVVPLKGRGSWAIERYVIRKLQGFLVCNFFVPRFD